MKIYTFEFDCAGHFIEGEIDVGEGKPNPQIRSSSNIDIPIYEDKAIRKHIDDFIALFKTCNGNVTRVEFILKP